MSIIGLPDLILSRICLYLQDGDVRAFGEISEKVAKIAKQEIERRDQLFEKLLSTYTISRTFNIESPKEADILLIGEVHYKEEYTKAETDLINFWGWRGPVILILEATPLDQKIAPRLFSQGAKKLNFRFPEENIHVLGWDNKEIDKLFEADSEIDFFASTIKLAENRKERDKIIDKITELVKKFDHKKLLEWGKLVNVEVLPSTDELMNMSVEVRQVYDLSIKVIKLKLEESDYIDYIIQSKLFCLDPINSKEIMKFFFNSKEQEPYRRINKKSLGNEMPQRTASMVKTLRNIGTYVSKNNFSRSPKILLIAGFAHLETPNGNKKNNPRYNLESLYQQLGHHKAAILIPAKAYVKWC